MRPKNMLNVKTVNEVLQNSVCIMRLNRCISLLGIVLDTLQLHRAFDMSVVVREQCMH